MSFFLLIFYGAASGLDGHQRLAAHQLESFQLLSVNRLCYVALVLEDVLDAHFFGPSLWLLIEEALKSTHGTGQRVNGTFDEILVDFTTFEWADDFVSKIKLFVVIEKSDEQITNAIFAYGHRRIFEMRQVLCVCFGRNKLIVRNNFMKNEKN